MSRRSVENTSIPLFSAFWLAAGPSEPEHAVEIQDNGVFTLRIGGLSRAATPRVLQVAQCASVFLPPGSVKHRTGPTEWEY